MTPPTLTRRMLNFTRASIRHFCKGMPTAPQHVIDERLEQCGSCTLFDPRRDVCLHEKCGCHIQTKWWLRKVGWADESCPIGRWGAVKV